MQGRAPANNFLLKAEELPLEPASNQRPR